MKLLIQVTLDDNKGRGEILSSLAVGFSHANPVFRIGDSGYIRDRNGRKIGNWFVQQERDTQIDSKHPSSSQGSRGSTH